MATMLRDGRLFMSALSTCLLLASVPASGADGLSVTDFGSWAIIDGVVPGGIAPNRLAPPIGPVLTAPAGIPRSGSASYTGATVGSATIGTAPFLVTGRETLTAQFGNRSTVFGSSSFGAVSGQFTLNKTSMSGVISPFASFSTGGPLVGTQFPIQNAPGKGLSFSATQVFGFAADSSSFLGGSAKGWFLGNNGQAIAGTWTLTNMSGAVSPSTPINAQGIFAARR
jgi:hypothetical protein